LEPIAKFFNITIQQLLGEAPIPALQATAALQEKPPLASLHETAGHQIISVPLLSWGEAIRWNANRDSLDLTHRAYEAVLDIKVSPNSFALVAQDASMEPLFSIGTKVIIDPEQELRDRRFVVLTLADSAEAILRQLIINGGEHFVKTLSPELSQLGLRQLESADKIIGVLVQAKRNFA
jgi:SOS-response transcriptional repressor LexA